MLYKEIPNIHLLEKEVLTRKEIMLLLNICSAIFDKAQFKPIDKQNGFYLYDTKEIIKKIMPRIEIYKECEFIPNYPNYIVNQKGEIFLIKGKIYPYKLKTKIDKYGYEIVALSNENGKKYIGVHRIVALIFIPNPLNLPMVNHQDGDKLRNYASNLEWCTVQYNTQHAFDMNLSKTGINNWKSSPVIAFKNSGEISGIYETISDCAQAYQINECTVRDSSKNKTRKGRCGYFFRKITKEKFYELKEDKSYEKFFVTHQHTPKCNKIA